MHKCVVVFLSVIVIFLPSCKDIQKNMVGQSSLSDEESVKPGKYGWRAYVSTDYKAKYKDYNTVLHGVSRKQFASLDTFVESFDELYPSGESKRTVFYDIFRDYDSINSVDPQKWFSKYIENLTLWRETGSHPEVADIALANFYINIAWFHRGNGWAKTVTEEQWEKFNDNIEKAKEVLNQSEYNVTSDPHYYSTVILLGRASHATMEEIFVFFNKGQDIAPEYLPLYYEVNELLQPKWSGETPQQWHTFLVKALEPAKLSKNQKDMLYGLMVRENIRGLYKEYAANEIYTFYGIDVDRFINGLGLYSESLPDSSNWADNYLYHAHKAGKEAAVIDALKQTKGCYNADRWKGNSWFVHLDEIMKTFPATEHYIILDEKEPK